MDRRTLILSGLVSLGTAGLAQARTPADPYNDPGPPPPQPSVTAQPSYPAAPPAQTFSRDEIVNKVSDFMGVTAESAGAVVEKVFAQQGRPTGYIAGEEGSGAFAVGLRYGRGLL